MRKSTRFLVHGAALAALYTVLTYLQNLLFADSTSAMIQFRASEALCVLALFTPAAIPGLTVGCLLFNLSVSPLDAIVGTAATALATTAMYLTRNIRIKGYPFPALLMPALFNGIMVGWMLSVITDIGFWLNAACVAIGELGVLFTLGTVLFYTIRSRRLQGLFQ